MLRTGIGAFVAKPLMLRGWVRSPANAVAIK
jgi:hypothetical protein